MPQGRVKWFNNEKGFGFIEAANGGDIFVHYSAIEEQGRYRTLRSGELVEYELREGDKGLHAAAVRSLGEGGSVSVPVANEEGAEGAAGSERR